MLFGERILMTMTECRKIQSFLKGKPNLVLRIITIFPPGILYQQYTRTQKTFGTLKPKNEFHEHQYIISQPKILREMGQSSLNNQ